MPFLLLLVFGAVEFGYLFMHSVAQANSIASAGRVGAATTATVVPDSRIIEQLKSRKLALTDAQRVVIYKAAAENGKASAQCLAGSSVANVCNVYSVTASGEVVGSESSWPAASRVPGSDYLGVAIVGKHSWLSGVFKDSISLQDSGAVLIEPAVSEVGPPNNAIAFGEGSPWGTNTTPNVSGGGLPAGPADYTTWWPAHLEPQGSGGGDQGSGGDGELLMSRRLKSSNSKTDEQGIAIVLTSVFAIAFCGLVAFGVDLGYWYLQSERVQRAADNAALAAASSLPSPNATADGYAGAAKNGYANGGDIEVEVTAAGARSVVSVTDKSVETFFASVFMDHLSISRTATAEKSSSLPMGSPYNVLGTGDLDLQLKTGGAFPKSNTWLAINGPCSAREDGDYFMSKYIGNKGATKTLCPGPTTNPAYDINGYSYYIDVPEAQTGSVKVRLYDPAYNPRSDGESPDGNLTQANDRAGYQDTSYWLWQVNADGTETLVHQFGYRWFSLTAPPGEWADFATIPAASVAGGRQFRLQVAARDFEKTGSTSPRSWSVNAFSIWADTGDGKVCDSRTDNACPQVYGKTAVSLLNNVAAAVSDKATFMLAGVPENFAGSKASVSIFDPGEGVQSIEVLMPNGQLGTFDWQAYPGDINYSGTAVKSIDVSGLGQQPYAGDAAQPGSNYKFNDRRVVLDLHIPADVSQWMGANGNNWWQIQYTIKPGSVPLPDRTTWGADLGGNAPAHLVRN